jgi:hypothetical protein
MSTLATALRATALSVLFIGIPATAFAGEASPDLKTENESLRTKIEEIQAQQAAQNKALLDKIQQLEAKQNAQQAATQDQQKAIEQKVQQALKQKAETEQSAAIDSVLRDSDQHSRFFTDLGADVFYDVDHGLSIRSDDKTFLWHPSLLFQFGYDITYRNAGRITGDDTTAMGFEIHRIRAALDGHIFSQALTYKFLFDTTQGLQDAWVKYEIPNFYSLSVQGGQFKNPFDHEELVDDSRQLAFDRSYTEGTLANGEGYVDGVSVIYDPGSALRAEAAFTNGNNNPNSTFQSFPTSAANFGLVARGEYKFWGNWNDYKQFTSLNNSEQLLVVGAAMDVTQSGHITRFSHVLDAQWNPGPLAVYGAFLGRLSGNGNLDGSDAYDYSFRLQGSYLLNKQWEAFARYSFTHFDGGEFPAKTKTDVHELTFGGNYYLHNHQAKFTAEVIFLPTGAPVGDVALGVLPNNNHGEIILHGQFQLLI